ncbi:MAG: hypothetical protein AAGI12_13530 [Pseudomonadota bacterium]
MNDYVEPGFGARSRLQWAAVAISGNAIVMPHLVAKRALTKVWPNAKGWSDDLI